jgi:hypothetical protein
MTSGEMGGVLPVSDPVSARVLTYHVVTNWVAKAVGLQSGADVEVSRKFVGAPTAGYDFDDGQYIKMCNEITHELVVTSGRSFTLDGPWRLQHENDEIASYINAVALKMLAGHLTPAGIAAHEWAMGS